MKSKIAKGTFVIATLALCLGIQQYSGWVFGGSSEDQALLNKMAMENRLQEELREVLPTQDAAELMAVLNGSVPKATAKLVSTQVAAAPERPVDQELKAHLEAIFKAERDYKNYIYKEWQAARVVYDQLPVQEQTESKLFDCQLSVRNDILSQNQLDEANMLPMFKALRVYLEENHLDKDLANAVENHYEADKQWLILLDMPITTDTGSL